MTAKQIGELFDILVRFAQIIGAIGTAGAFWVTWATLREMKRQTDLASNPQLKVRFRLPKRISRRRSAGRSVLVDHYQREPYETWRRIITQNLDQDISALEDQHLTLELTNAGKSEITQVAVTLALEVSMFENEVLGFSIEPTPYEWPIEAMVELSERESVLVPITNIRYFPIYICRISDVRYRDVRGNHYEDFDGPPDTGTKQNEILRPRRSSAKPEPALGSEDQ